MQTGPEASFWDQVTLIDIEMIRPRSVSFPIENAKKKRSETYSPPLKKMTTTINLNKNPDLVQKLNTTEIITDDSRDIVLSISKIS